MSLVRFDPFNLFRPAGLWEEGDEASATWMPIVDISENENAMIVKAELPGVELKDITVSLDNNVLMIKGERRFEKEMEKENYFRVERRYGNFSRSFALPTFLDESKVSADFKNGILKIVIPKKDHVKSRIEVKAA